MTIFKILAATVALTLSGVASATTLGCCTGAACCEEGAACCDHAGTVSHHNHETTGQD